MYWKKRTKPSQILGKKTSRISYPNGPKSMPPNMAVSHDHSGAGAGVRSSWVMIQNVLG